jgi:hypothetical protein
MAGEAYSASVSASGGTGALVYSLAAGSLPDGLVLNISTGALTGPLAEGATVGDYDFTLMATDSRSRTGTASFTLKVVERTVTVADRTVTVPAGSTPPNVYLNRGATGGPFSGADVLSVEPANAGTAEIIQGELAASGTVTPVGYYLKFTPSVYYSGHAVVRYKLTSTLGASGGAITYVLTADDQAVADRVDTLVHDFVQSRQNLLANQVKVPGLKDRRRMSTAGAPVTTTASGTDGTGASTFGFATSLAAVEAARAAAESGGAVTSLTPPDFNLWIDGSLSLHRDDESGGEWGTFGLLNIGADYLANDRFLVGLSLHVDRMTDPTDEDEKLTGNGWLVGPYASVELVGNIVLDASLRYGGSDNDIEAGDYVGSFETTRWMADAKLEGQWQLDPVTTFAPSLRLVYFDEKVADYEISGSTGDILALAGFTERQMRVSLGGEFTREITLSEGLVLTPALGVTAGLAGLDNSGAFGSVSAGATLASDIDWSLDARLLYSLESEGVQTVGARVAARVRF